MARAPVESNFGMSPPYSGKYPCALGSACVLNNTCREFCKGLALHLDGIELEDQDGVTVMVKRVLLK